MTGRIISGAAAFTAAVCMGVSQTAAADPQPIAELLKALNASGYPSPLHPPEFTGFTIDNKKVSLSGLHGRAILINFWATWCQECRPEMPMFDRLHREYSARGLAVLGINAREEASTMRQYAKELALTFPLITDPRGQIGAAYGVVALPTTFLLRRNGRARGVGSRAKRMERQTGSHAHRGTAGRAVIGRREAVLRE